MYVCIVFPVIVAVISVFLPCLFIRSIIDFQFEHGSLSKISDLWFSIMLIQKELTETKIKNLFVQHKKNTIYIVHTNNLGLSQVTQFTTVKPL